MASSDLTVGILGGMGPEATLDFMAKVIAMTAAEKDQDHVRMIVDHNPRVPNRQAAIRSGSAEVEKELAAMAARLEAAGADFLVMPCNSAHAFAAAIRQAVAIPFVSIIAQAIRQIEATVPEARRVGVLATDGLLEAGIYQQALAAAGREALLPRDDELARLMSLIGRVKAGDKGREVAEQTGTLAELLASAGAEVIVAACTEIPLVLPAGNISVPVISSTDALARATVDLAQGRASFPQD
jgi:aspartate racemase